MYQLIWCLECLPVANSCILLENVTDQRSQDDSWLRIWYLQEAWTMNLTTAFLSSSSLTRHHHLQPLQKPTNRVANNLISRFSSWCIFRGESRSLTCSLLYNLNFLVLQVFIYATRIRILLGKRKTLHNAAMLHSNFS